MQLLRDLDLTIEAELKEFLEWHRRIVTWGLGVYGSARKGATPEVDHDGERGHSAGAVYEFWGVCRVRRDRASGDRARRDRAGDRASGD
jgi:hypothetical protein